MQELTPDRAMLVLVRHGQSEWNFANRFIGWYDSPLTEEGQWEADNAGSLLRDKMLEVDEVHTSMLSRTVHTAKRALEKMRQAGLKVPENSELRCSWRLNERSYGALTGRNKKECTKQYGKDQLKLWRRSWDVPPPQYEESCDLYQQETDAFRSKVELLSSSGLFDPAADPPPEELPRGESLEMTQKRLQPYWEKTLLPSLLQGRRVMVFGHENNLRALVKLLDGIGEREILEVDIPRAVPLVYIFKRDRLLKGGGIPRLEPVELNAVDGAEQLSARYLVDSQLIQAFKQRDAMQVYDTSVEENLEEVCVIDEEAPDMCQTIDEYRQESDGDEDEVQERRSFDTVIRQTSSDSAFLLPLRSAAPGPSAAAPGQEKPRTGGSWSLGLLAAAGVALLTARPHRRRALWVSRRSSATPLHDKDDEELDVFGNDEEADEGPTHGDTIVAGEDEDICELIGFDLGPELEHIIGRPFNEEERRDAYEASGFMRAKTAERGQALWLIGPSASGKSTLAPRAASWVGIDDLDYVVIDGEAFRDSHQGYMQALKEGQQKGCVWWGAYVGIRENVNKEKQRMLSAAVKEKKNLVIPSTCLRKSQCVDVANMLLEEGYLLHIVGIYGDKTEIVARGRNRAKDKGKRYDPREFTLALKQFAPMMRLCNGQYFMVCSTDGMDSKPLFQGSAPLPEEDIQHICREVLAACNCESEGCDVDLSQEEG